MNLLMLGWEFPPAHSGGLGTACYGLAKGLSKNNVDVTFILPRMPCGFNESFLKLIPTDGFPVKMHPVDSPLVGYMSSNEYVKCFNKNPKEGSIYGTNLLQEVHRYAQCVKDIVKGGKYDVIHAHDWMTYKAGIEAKRVCGCPLVVHVHATEFDRTGGNGVNQYVYDVEREGMHLADLVIAVSNFTKQKIVENYSILPEKVVVVHNAVDFDNCAVYDRPQGKTVLFLGRVTLQKGPDYFVYVAKKVLEYDSDVRFIVAGDGDMLARIIVKCAELGISDKVLFTGFLRGRDVDSVFQMADLYVMPSVSEPFGITPLESLRNGTPVLISRQSGISEVLTHCLKTDFWDIDEMANQILATLRYRELHSCLKDAGCREVLKFNWEVPARKCIEVYERMMAM